MPDDTTIDALVNELVNSLAPAHHRGAVTGAFVTLEVEYAALRLAATKMLNDHTAAVQAPLLEQIKTLTANNVAAGVALQVANDHSAALLRDLESRGAVVVQPPVEPAVVPVVEPVPEPDVIDPPRSRRSGRAE